MLNTRPGSVGFQIIYWITASAFLLAAVLLPAFATNSFASFQEKQPQQTDAAERNADGPGRPDADSNRDPGPDSEDDSTVPVPVRIDLTNLTELTGQKIDIMKTDGQVVGNVIVTLVREGKLAESIKAIKVSKPGEKRQSSISVSQISELYINEYPLDVKYDRRNRCLVHDAEKRSVRLEATRELKEKLTAIGERLWEPMMPEQQEEYLTIHRQFLDRVKETMPDIEFRLVETEFYLFYTDLSPEEVDGYIYYLDEMYKVLCGAFGIPPTRNIWCGKCVVVAFGRERDYLTFERNVMNVNGTGSQGMCHSYPDGKVVFAGFKGDGGFGSVLVHETSHGFVHRYLSSVEAPSWLNEGMADWLAHEIVGGNRIPTRRVRSAQLIQQRGSWGDLLGADRIDGEMYGAASTLVEILLQLDNGGQFKQFFDDIKRGKDPEEALKDSFNMSFNDLQLRYAEAISR